MGLFAVPIIALRNEKGSYNLSVVSKCRNMIIALRNEKGSYNLNVAVAKLHFIIALRNEKGSYNTIPPFLIPQFYYSTAK